MHRLSRLITAAVVTAFLPAAAPAQDLPAEYQAVLTALNKKGDFKDGVFKVNIPRSDLTVKIGSRAAPTPFGFGGWVAMTAGSGMQVMMGDLVLTEDEVNPVMSAILDNGLSVTALHNHFFWEQPRIFYMHVHGMGTAADLARKLKPAIALIDAAAARATSAAPAAGAPAAGVTGATVARIIGHQGEQTGPVYKITIGRPDIDVREHGAKITARMGLNTWAAFAGSDADAMVAGDVAMLESEVQPVLKALRAHGIDIVAIHHHMTDVKPVVIFLHYYGTGPATKLAAGVRAAVDLLGKARPSVAMNGQGSGTPETPAKPPTVLFMCPHGAAKSVLASAYFQRLAKERGLNVRVESAGTEPDAEVAPAVAAHLVKNGYPIPAKPRSVTAGDLETADVVISMGCDLKGFPAPRGRLLKWDEVPGPGENFAAADAAIRKRVLELVDELMRQTRAR